MSIKAKLLAGDHGAKADKNFVPATIKQTTTDLVITIPRVLNLDDLSDSEKTLFAKVRAVPESGCGFLVTDTETGKKFNIPVNRDMFLNIFASWKDHTIQTAPAAPLLAATKS